MKCETLFDLRGYKHEVRAHLSLKRENAKGRAVLYICERLATLCVRLLAKSAPYFANRQSIAAPNKQPTDFFLCILLFLSFAFAVVPFQRRPRQHRIRRHGAASAGLHFILHSTLQHVRF